MPRRRSQRSRRLWRSRRSPRPPDVAPVLEERERLRAGLQSLGVEVLPSSANFLFVPLERAERVSDFLLARGIIVRDFPEAIRVTVLDAAANDRFLDVFASALQQVV